MKIAVETTDGVKLDSPFSLLQNFIVYEVDDKNKPKDFSFASSKTSNKRQIRVIGRISDAQNMFKEIGDCSTVISHSLDRKMLNTLKRSGVEVYITFKNKIEDAIGQYLRDKMIHKFAESN